LFTVWFHALSDFKLHVVIAETVSQNVKNEFLFKTILHLCPIHHTARRRPSALSAVKKLLILRPVYM